MTKGVCDGMRTKFARIVSAILAVAICICFCPTLSGYAATQAQIDRHKEGQKVTSNDIDFNNKINIDQSFAYQVRMATNAADRQASAGNPIGGVVDLGGYGPQLTMSNIGPFYGYSEGEIEDATPSPQNVRTANSDTPATRMYSREWLARAQTSSLGSDDYVAMTPSFEYYSYGLLLSMLGLDSVGSEASDITRQSYGTIAEISYMAASAVNMIFESCFNFLWASNPFLFFKDIATTARGHDVLTEINANATNALTDVNSNTTPINALTAYFGQIFDTFANFAWTVSIPLSLLFIIVSFFLSRRGRYMIGSNIKKFLIRVVFAAIGIPILGSAYTQVLDGLRNTQSTSDAFLSQAVSRTFVDFGAWVETSRLTPPLGYSLGILSLSKQDNTISKGSMLATSSSICNLRNICHTINQTNDLFSYDLIDGLTVSTSGILLKDYTDENELTIKSTLSNTGKDGSNAQADYKNRESVNEIIKNYKNGTKYTATMFESGTVAWMQSQSQNGTSYGDMLALSTDKYSFSPATDRLIHGLQGEVDADGIKYDPKNPGDASTYAEVAKARFAKANTFAGVNYNIWNNGHLGISYTHYEGVVSDGDRAVDYTVFTGAWTTQSDGYDCSNQTGLSTMSMYTYLTSEFTQEGILVYGNSPSVYTHKFHYAVNLIGGNGIMQFAFLANMVAILLGYFFLAVAFVFRTIFDILFKGFQIMGHALLAVVGFYKAIGTCICMVVNMIAQLFITVVFFSFMVDFMFMLVTLFDNLFLDLFGTITGLGNAASIASANTAKASYAAEVLVTLASLISTFVIVFFVSFATKWRALIMNSINNMVESIVGTCLGVQLSGVSDGALGGMMKSAFNDAKNVAKVAATVGGGIALADSAQDMLQDLSNAEDDGGETAADAAVNPSANPNLGGKAGQENDPERTADGKDVLENGFGSRMAATADAATITAEDQAAMQNMSDEEKQEYLYNKALKAFDTAKNAGAAETADGDALAIVDLHSKALAKLENDGAAESETSSENISPFMNALDDIEQSKSGNKSSTLSYGTSFAHLDKLSDSKNSENTNADGNSGKGVGGYYYGGTATQEAQRKLDENTSALGDGGILSRNGSIKLDAQRGLVMSSQNEDGTSSDVALNTSGLSISSTDTNGTTTMQRIGTDGTINLMRTSQNGTVSSYTATMGGDISSQKIETLADGSTQTTIIDTSGVKTITTTNATTGEQTVKRVDVNGTYTVEGRANGREFAYSGLESGFTDVMINNTAIRQEVDTANNVVTQRFTTGSNSYEIIKASTGSTEISTTVDGANCQYSNHFDGGSVYTVTASDGSIRREVLTVGSNGTLDSKVEYCNAKGETITDNAVRTQLDEHFNKSWTNIEADVLSIYGNSRMDMQNSGIQDLGGSTLKRTSGDKVQK